MTAPVIVGPDASESFPAIGTTATVVITDRIALPIAVEMLRQDLDDLDRACSRFRPDSEVRTVEHQAGHAVQVGAVLAVHLDAALRAARITDGLLDPTVGTCMDALGYDRDLAEVTDTDADIVPVPAPGWWRLAWSPADRSLLVPRGTRIDLGSTAKALAADLAATRIAGRTGCGVLISLGGDLAVAGPPPAGGWRIHVTDDHAQAGPGPVISLASGGLATSGTTRRRWRRGRRHCHHVVDPRTGLPAQSGWRTVTVAAGACVDANIAATASLLLGAAAPGWLTTAGLPARLVGDDGQVRTIGQWPPENEGDL
ncbi:MAG: FAD:protein FMN transferase [Pseudonocardia sp.]|uniref:FAD:protein FMN transferase n=1 Tax=unclassified Pseudonocardia TaxID=2619320 RepID=UPI000B25C7DC|nr:MULTISPECIES: FAD:protein FMN transferase [unclassified Pseudonocardia]MBN9109767.1 FAD:protein FMN transferase [Pseudonocardia sp.]